jgi:tetratricopeptide (TPR) repeat protein
MKNDAELFDKIEDFLAAKLSTTEALAFQKEVTQNPELAKLIELHQLEREGLTFLVEQNLREKIKNWETNPPKNPHLEDAHFSKNRQSILWILGTIAVLLTAVIFYFFTKKEPAEPSILPKTEAVTPNPNIAETPVLDEKKLEKEEIQRENAQKNRFLATSENAYSASVQNWEGILRSSATDNLAEAKTFLKEKKPSLAIPILEKMAKMSDPILAENAQKLLAHAYFQTNSYAAAAAIFRQFSKKTTTRDEAEWYLLLCLVADYANQKPEADTIFEQILEQNFPDNPENNHPFLAKTLDLKRKLDKK